MGYGNTIVLSSENSYSRKSNILKLSPVFSWQYLVFIAQTIYYPIVIFNTYVQKFVFYFLHFPLQTGKIIFMAFLSFLKLNKRYLLWEILILQDKYSLIYQLFLPPIENIKTQSTLMVRLYGLCYGHVRTQRNIWII